MDTYIPGINVIICPSILNKIERHFITDVFSETNFENWIKNIMKQDWNSDKGKDYPEVSILGSENTPKAQDPPSYPQATP